MTITRTSEFHAHELHPLEHNEVERQHFVSTLDCASPIGRSAYRRAVEALTGSLPTWAIRGKPGRKATSKKHP